jgi:hypothetical protein
MTSTSGTGRCAALFFLLVLGFAVRCGAAKGEEELADRVRKAIDRGIQFLKAQEKGKGNWEADALESQSEPGGWTALALLALLNSGVKADDPVVERGLISSRSVAPARTYVVGLQTMVFVAAGKQEDRLRIQRNVAWLIAARVMAGSDLLGWSYGMPGNDGILSRPDNSNTQYALLGLQEAKLAGIPIPREVWLSIRTYYACSQIPDGLDTVGWKYENHGGSDAASFQ